MAMSKLILIMAAVWCLLSGHYTLLLLGLGLISCLLSVWVYQKVTGPDEQWISLSRPIQHIRYCLWLLKEIVVSNIDVIKTIINPKRLEPSFFETETKDLSEKSTVVYANSITLTPGTVTTEIHDNKLSVHALTAASRESVLTKQMHDRVKQLGGESG